MSPFRASAAFTEEWEHFDFTVDDGIATVTFSRPDKLNALSAELVDSLSAAAGDAAANPEVRVIALAGAGRAF